jgi:hypothetical protein
MWHHGKDVTPVYVAPVGTVPHIIGWQAQARHATYDRTPKLFARVRLSPRGHKNVRFCPRVRLRLEVPPAARRIFSYLFFSSFL